MNVAMMLKTDESAIAEIRISALLMVNVSQATLSTKLQSRQLPCSDTKTYIGMTENDFKTRYNNHKLSFKERKHSQDTVLSKHIWHVRPSVRPSVRPPAPQDHQYEVAHTWDNLCCWSRVLAWNRMVTRVLSKDNKSQKQFYWWKEKVQKNTQLSFWWKAKSSSYEVAFEDFNFLVGSTANSVGTTLEFAAFRSGPDAKYSGASAFWFFLCTTMVFAAVRTHFPRKNTSFFMLISILSWEKERSNKISFSQCQRFRPSGIMPACHVGERG